MLRPFARLGGVAQTFLDFYASWIGDVDRGTFN